MKISIIAAFNQQFVIGLNGKIPWHIPEDLRRFKQLTMGKPIIMGRATWESLGSKPLPGRLNVVVSESLYKSPPSEDVIAHRSLTIALRALKSGTYADEAFIIGGERLYQEAIPLADKMYLTTVKKGSLRWISDADSVAYFPIWVSTPDMWNTTYREDFSEYAFKDLERIK